MLGFHSNSKNMVVWSSNMNQMVDKNEINYCLMNLKFLGKNTKLTIV